MPGGRERGRSGRGWAYTGVLLGGAVSIAANVAHSYVPPDGAPAGWRPQTGAVISAVTEVQLSYVLQSTASAPMTLSPAWRIATDSGDYLVSCGDGSVSRG